MNQGYSLRYHGKLSISEDSKSILVSGDTFAYAFDKGNGLISKLEIAGQDFLQGMEPGIPDISILGNPEDTLFAARYEDEAECDIISESPYEVRIRTHGVYHDSSHNTLPIRYRITYEIHNDGTIFIMVDNKAYESCSIRWLCVSKGVLNPSFCRYYAHLADFAENDSLDCYTFRKMEEKEILFSGTLIPWFWFGNDISGIEISIRDNISESMKAGMSKTTGVMWEVISIPVSDEALNVSPGWEQTNYFSISITPSKRYLPEFSSLIAYREDRYENVTDDEIYEFSRKGCNLMIVSINRSGEFVPNDEPEIRRVISKCHEYGMKIVPYISLMELSREREHKEEWLVKPESDTENQVMCPASEGWREFWKQSIKDLIDKYDFDGLYIDIHYDRLACQNPLHGCNRRYMRPSLIWVRDMLRYAWIRVKSKSFESMVIANTELLPVSMICNWADIRSFGKLFDIRNMDDISRKAFYDSHRLGCNSLMNASQSVDRQLISLSLLYMASPVLDKTTVNESDLILPYKVLESFGVSRSSLLYTEIRADENLRINIHKHESILMTMVNISPDELDSDIDILQFDPGLQEDKEYMVYEPLSKSLFGDKDPWKYEEFLRFHVTIPSYDYRILYIREKPNKNCVLFALGSNRVLEEHFDVQSGSLSFSLEAMVNTKLSVVIYCSKKPSQILSNDTIRHFVWNDDQKLAFLDINADRSVTEVKVL